LTERQIDRSGGPRPPSCTVPPSLRRASASRYAAIHAARLSFARR